MFRQLAPDDELFLIRAGRINLVKFLEDGSELTLDIRKAGDLVGEEYFSGQLDYSVSAICLENTFICGVSKNKFEQLVR